jgi:feruloyl esterase
MVRTTIFVFLKKKKKVLAYGNSRRFYDLISTTLSQPNLDPWYRLFLIPGMSHCVEGLGQWKFGQGASLGIASVVKNDTAHNILLAMVDWVENGVAPDYVIGSDPNSDAERMHCRYPQKSHWDGKTWICV